MSNISSIRPSTIPPFSVVNTLQEKIANIDAIYVCTIENGEPVLYASGELKDLCTAAIAMTNLAQDFLNGKIKNE